MLPFEWPKVEHTQGRAVDSRVHRNPYLVKGSEMCASDDELVYQQETIKFVVAAFGCGQTHKKEGTGSSVVVEKPQTLEHKRARGQILYSLGKRQRHEL